MPGITDPAEEYFKDGLWGWDGSAWRKLPLLWGFGGVVEEKVQDTGLDAGDNNLGGAAVPAGEIWVVTSASCLYVGTAPDKMRIYAVGLASALPLLEETSVVSDVFCSWSGTAVLQEDDYVRLWVKGATAGDDAYLYYAGYKMKIAE